MHCVVITKEIKDLAKEIDEPVMVTAARVSAWQETFDSLEEIPTKEELMNSTGESRVEETEDYGREADINEDGNFPDPDHDPEYQEKQDLSNTPEENKNNLELLTNNNLNPKSSDILTNIIHVQDNPYLGLYLALIKASLNKNKTVKVQVQDNPGYLTGRWDPITNTIGLAKPYLESSSITNIAYTIAHEFTHSFTAYPFIKVREGKALNDNEREFVDNINQIIKDINEVASAEDKTRFAYELGENQQEEFIAAVMSKRSFISYLRGFWTRITDSILNFLMGKDDRYSKNRGFYERAYNEVVKFISTQSEVQPIDPILNENRSPRFEDLNTDIDIKIEDALSPKERNILDAQIKSKENLVRELNAIKGAEPDRRADLNERIRLIDTSIENLKAKGDYAMLLMYQDRTIKDASKLLDKTNINQDDLKLVQGIIEQDKVLLDLLSSAQDELRRAKVQDQHKELIEHHNDLSEKYKDIRGSYLTKIANRYGIDYEDLDKLYKDISVGTLQFLSTEESEIPELIIISKLKQMMDNSINEESFKIEEVAKNLLTKYPNYQEIIQTFFDNNGHFISSTKSEYFDKEYEQFQKLNAIKDDEFSTSKDKAMAYRDKDYWMSNNNDYTTTEELNKLYNRELQALKDNYGENSDEMKDFIKDNSPERYLQYIEDVLADTGVFLYAPRNGYRFLKQTPKRDIWENKEFSNIENHELYKFITDLIIQSYKKIPHRMAIEAEFFDRVLNQFQLDLLDNKFNLSTLLSGLKNTWGSWYSPASNNNEEYNVTYTVKDEKGREKKFILKPNPKEFQKNTNKSLIHNLLLFNKMATVYDHQEKVLPIIQLFQEQLQNREAISVDKKTGNPTYSDTGELDENGRPKLEINTIKEGLDRANKLLTYMIESQFFGEKKQDEISQGVVKPLDNLINYTRVLGIGLKPFTAMSNALIGFSTNYWWAARNRDFDDKSYWKASTMLFGNILSWWTKGNLKLNENTKLLPYLMDRFKIMESGISKFEGDWQSKVSDILYKFQTSTEFLIHGQGLIAKMLYTKVQNKAGEDSNLWEYYKDQLFKKGKFNAQPEWEHISNYEGDKDELKYNSKLQKFLEEFKNYRKATQGDYFNNMRAKKDVWFRILMIFRTWLPAAIHQRFGGENTSLEFKGRYITYRDLALAKGGGIKGGLKSLLPIIKQFAGIKTDEDLRKSGLSDLDIENMRVNIRELRMMTFFITLALLLKYIDQDDKDKNLALLINLSTRNFYDLSFFYLPSSTLNIVRNILPITTVITNTTDLLTYSTKYLEDPNSDIIQTGIWKDHSKLGRSFMREFPGANAIPSTIGVINQKFSSQGYKYSN